MTGSSISLDRLKADMEALGAIGRSEGSGGCSRPAFSPADMEARAWFASKLEAMGLDPHMDGAGNVSAVWGPGSGPVIMVGSHLDTVPDGGMFDGALGVCAALEAVRTLMDREFSPARRIEIIGTADEEGRFGGMLGSQALTGEVSRDWLETAVDADGIRLWDAMDAAGLDPRRATGAARAPNDIIAFLELHIEQGPVLSDRRHHVGIVDCISGVFNWRVTLTGAANHSGTTPMTMRKDAFAGAVEFARRIPDIITECGTDQSRLTVGKIALEPNFAHTIPGKAVFSLIGRDTALPVMTGLAAACREAIHEAADVHGLGCRIDQMSWLDPVRLDTGLAQLADAHAAALGLDARIMPSGAGHDAQTMAGMCPSLLLFVPSKGGISHAPEEWTEWSDVENGANLLLQTLTTLAD